MQYGGGNDVYHLPKILINAKRPALPGLLLKYIATIVNFCLPC